MFNSLFMQPKLRLLGMTVAVVLMSFITTIAFGQATVTSDKPDYAPRSNAVFTGSGFLPGETVVLKVKNISHACNTIAPDSSYTPWSVVADASGGFVTNWTVCDCNGDSLRLRAVGQTSGSVATLFFSDNVISVNILSPTNGSPASVAAGCQITINYSYSTNTAGGSSNGTATINIKNASGTLVSGTQTILRNTSTINSITFTIPPSANVGSYNVEVIANQGGNGMTATQNSAINVSAATVLAPTGVGSSRCGAGTVTIFASAGGGETIDWYDAATGGNLLASATGSFTTPSISTTTTYYAETRDIHSGCISTRTAVVATVLTTVSSAPVITSTLCAVATTVSGTSSEAAGSTIKVYRNGLQVGTATVVAGSPNTWTASIPGSGAGNVITATATATGKCESVASGSVTIQESATPTVTISQTAGTSQTCVGNSVTFTATASNTGGGTVSYAFYDNGVEVQAASSSNTFTTSSLSAAIHSITAKITIAGGTCLTASTVTSTGVLVTVYTPPSFFVQPSDITTTYGDGAVVFSASVSSPTTLSYQWQVNTSSGFEDIPGANYYTLTVSNPTVAMSGYKYHLVATNSCGTVTSNDVTLKVNQKALLITANDRTKTYGQSVTFAGTEFTPHAGDLVNSDAVSSVTLNSDGAAASATVTTPGPDYDIVPGAATGTGLGNYNITYANGTLHINQSSTTTILISGQNPSVFGQVVDLTATVTPVAPGAGSPTGNVIFRNGSTPIGTIALVTVSGAQKATLSISTLAVNTSGHSITAEYVGDPNFIGSTFTGVNQVVNKASTSLTLTATSDPSVVGQNVTYSAVINVTAPGAGIPTGTVLFKADGSPYGIGTVSSVGGVTKATFTDNSLPLGPHAIEAIYQSDVNFLASSSSIGHTVIQAATTTVLTSSLNPSVYGQNVTFTVTVTVTAPGSGTATGSVTFKDGATTLSTTSLIGGVATYNTTALIAGNHSITAVYTGSSDFIGSTSNMVNQLVNKASTYLTISQVPDPVQYSDTVQLSAVVSAENAVAQAELNTTKGTVTFSINFGGGNVASFPADNYVITADGLLKATSTYTVIAAKGNYPITVVFTPSSDNLNGKTQTGINLNVEKENSVIDYTGPLAVATSSSSSGAAVITMIATVRDITAVPLKDDDVTPNPSYDPFAGNITKSKVRFLLEGVPVVNYDPKMGAITDAQGWTSVALVNSSDIKTATVLIKKAVDIGNSNDAVQYTLAVEVGNQDYYVADGDETVVNVYKPLNDFITGGGYVIPTRSNGEYAANGRKANFGFNVKYNKSGKSLQGNINVIFRRWESTGLHIYQIKGNSMTSLTVNSANTKPASNTNPKTAIFDGKANMQDITNPLSPVSMGGNLTLHVTMTDRGEPGSADQIGITVYSSGGGILYSSDWDGVKTSELYLKGGNILVSNSTIVSAQAPLTTVRQATTIPIIEPGIFTLRAYPNPSNAQFTLQMASSDVREKVQVRIMDMSGRVIQEFNNLNANQNLQIGATYRPGVYIVEMIQGGNRKQLKLIKQPN